MVARLRERKTYTATIHPAPTKKGRTTTQMEKKILILCILFTSCAHKQLTVPQPGAVQGGISRVKTSAVTAETQRKEIERLNAEARAKQQRIDNKDIFLEGYRRWKQKQ